MGFFKSKSPQEILRENKRILDRSIRDLERERMQVEGQVKKTMTEMKKMAKAGQEDVVRLMARDIVRMRGQITNFYKMRAQMQSVSMQMQVYLMINCGNNIFSSLGLIPLLFGIGNEITTSHG